MQRGWRLCQWHVRSEPERVRGRRQGARCNVRDWRGVRVVILLPEPLRQRCRGNRVRRRQRLPKLDMPGRHVPGQGWRCLLERRRLPVGPLLCRHVHVGQHRRRLRRCTRLQFGHLFQLAMSRRLGRLTLRKRLGLQRTRLRRRPVHDGSARRILRSRHRVHVRPLLLGQRAMHIGRGRPTLRRQRGLRSRALSDGDATCLHRGRPG